MPLSMSQTRKTSPCSVPHVLLMNYFCIFEETSIKDLFLLRNNFKLPKRVTFVTNAVQWGRGYRELIVQCLKWILENVFLGSKKFYTLGSNSNLFIFHQKYCKRLPRIKCMRLEIHIERFYPQGEPINN